MLDHGQLGPPTPSSIGAFNPAESRRPSMNDLKPRRPSVPDQLGGDSNKPSMARRGSSRGSFSETKARLLGLDGPASFGRGMSETLSMSALEVDDEREIGKEKKPDSPSVNGLAHPHSISAQLYANPKLAALRTTGLPKSTTPSPTLASVPPILADQRCSGYFVEAVRPCGYRLHSPHLMVLDEMDGTVSRERRVGWKDHLPE
jgi:dual specificity phosphatase 12